MSYGIVMTAKEVQRRRARQMEAKAGMKKLRGLGVFGLVCTVGLFTPFAPLAVAGLGVAAVSAGAVLGNYEAGESLDDALPLVAPGPTADFIPPTNMAQRILERRGLAANAPTPPPIPSYYSSKLKV